MCRAFAASIPWLATDPAPGAGELGNQLYRCPEPLDETLLRTALRMFERIRG
ncbi:hypothetical protein GFS60_07054 (plasmid) [Rhodococcus sp. WAY2]|nr:hypothetical protein GFS60_07054 [Rhodococcus sp. WAY2]